jgi:hypothetical protein
MFQWRLYDSIRRPAVSTNHNAIVPTMPADTLPTLQNHTHKHHADGSTTYTGLFGSHCLDPSTLFHNLPLVRSRIMLSEGVHCGPITQLENEDGAGFVVYGNLSLFPDQHLTAVETTISTDHIRGRLRWTQTVLPPQASAPSA